MVKAKFLNPEGLFRYKHKKKKSVQLKKCSACKGSGGPVDGPDCRICGGSGFIPLKKK